MVDRLQEPLKGITFTDLDGTLLTANSMHIFMKRLPGMLMKKGAFGASLGCYWQTWLRGLRLTSHRKMKWHLTKTAREHLEEEDWAELAAAMAETVNPSVSDYIAGRRAKGCLTYIVTAAAEEYAAPLCRQLGYDGVLATQFTEEPEAYTELREHAKHEAIEQFLASNQLRLESFLTDHTDDLPTAKAYPLLTILVGGSKKTSEAFREAGITRYIGA